MKSLSWLVVCLIGVTVALVSAVEKQGKPHAPITAVIVRSAVYSNEGIAHTTAINILDKGTIAKLEAFFPDYDKSPSSKNPPVGWVEGYCVYFNFGDGRSIEVTVASNDNGGIWTMGDGDLATNGNFAKFVEDLESRKRAKK